MGSNYFPGMISDSGAGGIVQLLIPKKTLQYHFHFPFFFVCGRGVLTIDPSVPSGSVYAL